MFGYSSLPRKAATDKGIRHSGMGVAHHSCSITFLYVCTELIHSCFQVKIPILVCFNIATCSTRWSNSDCVERIKPSVDDKINLRNYSTRGHAVAQLVDPLRYKPEGHFHS